MLVKKKESNIVNAPIKIVTYDINSKFFILKTARNSIEGV